MKKTTKRTAAAILAVATTAGMAGTTSLSLTKKIDSNVNKNVVRADVATAGRNTLEISKYNKNIKLYDEFTMPTAKLVDNSGNTTTLTEYTVTTPSGGTFTQEKVSDGKFVVDQIGTYTISYTKDGYKGEVTFNVETSTYNVDLVENDSNILPKKLSIKKDDGTAFTGEFNVPSYKVTDTDGNEVDAIVDIKVVKPDYSVLDISESKKITFNESNPIEVGYYIITYTAYKNNNGVKGEYLGKTKTEFNAVSSESYNNKYDLTLVYGSEKPSSVNVGKTINLPVISAKNGTEVVPVYYTVKVFKNGSSTPISDTAVVGNTDTKVITKNDKGIYEFTADQVGVYYRVEYTVKDALGNEKTTEFNIDTVEDTIDPTVLVVDAYSQEDANNLVKMENKDYDLKSIFGSEDVVIKAIYAEDLATFNYSDYKFERRIETSSRELIYKNDNFEDARKNIVFNHNGEELDSEKNVVIAPATTSLKDGVYYVYYTVTDANNRKTTVSYKFTVDKDFDWLDNDGLTEIKPTVKFNDTFYSSIELGEKIEFGSITASDDKDSRLKTKVYYKYTVDGAELEENVLELNDSNKYVIDTSTAPAGATKVTIYAEAWNDGGKQGIATQTIELKSQVLGTSVPTVYDVESYTNTCEQNTKITIPTIKFQDGEDGVASLNTEISVKCTTADDKVIEYTVQDLALIKVGDYLICSNANFIAATAGKYQVAVKVTDAAGNVVIKFLDYTVTDASHTGSLRFANMGVKDTELEVGAKYMFQPATIVGNDADLYDYYVKTIKTAGRFDFSNDVFVPYAEGEYKFAYVMYEKANPTNTIDSETYEFTITVKDTTGPQIHYEWKTERLQRGGSDIVEENSQEITEYPVGTKLLLPKFSISDNSGEIDREKSTITITSSKGGSRVIKYSEMDEKYETGKTGDSDRTMYYEFKYNGEYTIKFTAYDKAGNSTTKTETIKIGDLVSPTLVVSDEIVNSTYKSGSILSIDLADDTKNYITAFDNIPDTVSKEDVRITLYLNGTQIKNSNEDSDTKYTKYIFNLTDAGEYELRFTVKDDAGLETTVTKTFTVQDKGTSKMTSTEVVGTILIVVSVVVLAGVVVYFIISKRKMDKLYKG